MQSPLLAGSRSAISPREMEIIDEIEWRVSDRPVPYEEAFAFMEARAAAIREGTQRECVWLLEHPPLFTAGTSADPAELFNPENFDPEAKAGRHRYQYIPFGAGPRTCIGMGFAQAEALILLSRWLAEFRFSPAPGRRIDPVADFTLRPDGGLPLLVERV